MIYKNCCAVVWSYQLTRYSECFMALGDLENAVVDARVALVLQGDSAKVSLSMKVLLVLLHCVTSAIVCRLITDLPKLCFCWEEWKKRCH